VSAEVITTYQDLSRQLSVALCHEEHRTGYMSCQKRIMLSIQDDCSSNVEGTLFHSENLYSTSSKDLLWGATSTMTMI